MNPHCHDIEKVFFALTLRAAAGLAFRAGRREQQAAGCA